MLCSVNEFTRALQPSANVIEEVEFGWNPEQAWSLVGGDILARVSKSQSADQGNGGGSEAGVAERQVEGRLSQGRGSVPGRRENYLGQGDRIQMVASLSKANLTV